MTVVSMPYSMMFFCTWKQNAIHRHEYLLFIFCHFSFFFFSRKLNSTSRSIFDNQKLSCAWEDTVRTRIIFPIEMTVSCRPSNLHRELASSPLLHIFNIVGLTWKAHRKFTKGFLDLITSLGLYQECIFDLN